MTYTTRWNLSLPNFEHTGFLTGENSDPFGSTRTWHDTCAHVYRDSSIPLAVQAGRGMAASLLESRTSVPGRRPRSRNKYVVLFLLATLATSHALPTQTLAAAWDTVASFVSSPALPSTRPTSTLSQEKRDPSTTISRPSASVPMPDMDPPVDSIEVRGQQVPQTSMVSPSTHKIRGLNV